MRKKLSYEIVKEAFNKKSYILLDEEYINNESPLRYICTKHIDKGEQVTTYANIYMNHGCRWCGYEIMSEKQKGSKSHLWKGGASELSPYLRERIGQWKEDSLKACNGKCILTGKSKNIEIHHLYSFNSIIDETLKELNLEKHIKISNYTEEEIILIENKCIEIHYRYPLGVCIVKELHKEFHSIYGNENNTEEQFKEYVEKYYNNIEFKSKTINGQKYKYFPYKNNSTSKYKNVTKVKHGWLATITFKRKRIRIGLFENEYEAAVAYNSKAVELFGSNATLNLLDDQDKQEPKEKKKYYELKNNATSKYFGVSPSSEYGMWVARLNNNGKRLYLGIYETDWLAAEAFNKKSIELFGDSVILNKITNEDLKEKENYIFKNKNKSSNYIGVTYVMRDKKWNAYIRYNGKRLSLGYYTNQEDAALAYNKKAVELHGDNAKLNKVS